MRILGVDPGLEVMGYGVIDDVTFRVIEAGVIRTLPKTSIQVRLKKIFDSLSDIIDEHKPDVLVLEKIYSHYLYPQAVILMGHARGMACLVCGIHDIKLISYPSTRIKKAITGNGRASKEQVQRMVKHLLNLKKTPKPADVSDALAIAMTYCLVEKYKRGVVPR